MPSHGALASAKTEAEVLDLVRRELARMSLVERRLLAECPPPDPLSNPSDVFAYANRLVALPAHGESARFIYGVARFFSEAAARLHELRSGGGQP